MKSTTNALGHCAASDGPRVDQIKKLPLRSGRLKLTDIRKAVDAVVRERLARVAALHGKKASE